MAIFDDENSIDWDSFFQTEIVQSGNGVFEGYPYQRGFGNRTLRGHGLGNIFRSLFRILAPVAKKVGKAVGKQALKTGVEVAGDIVSGENIKQSFKNRGKAGAANLINKATRKLQGEGLGSRRQKVTKRTRGPAIKLGVLKRRRKALQLFAE